MTGAFTRLLGSLVLMTASSVASAQVYHCIENGSKTYRDTPCADSAKAVKVLSAGSATASKASTDLPWKGLAVGMSVAEVQKLAPAARQETGSKLKSGAQSLLNRQVTIAGVALRADYYFDQGGLVQVNANADDSLDNDEALRGFDRLTSQFNGVYGEPDRREVNNRPSGLSGSAAWGDGAWVSIMPVTAGTALLLSGSRLTR